MSLNQQYWDSVRVADYSAVCPGCQQGNIDGLVQFYAGHDNLSYTDFSHTECGYSRIEVRIGPIKTPLKFSKTKRVEIIP